MSLGSSIGVGSEIFVSFLRDISRRVAAEQALIKARDDAVAGEKAKADFIAVMSHEMRTPLNGMLGTLELFDFDEYSPKTREYLDIIKASGKLLLHHVDNVLDISRAEAGKVELSERVFSVPALVRELVESQRGVSEHRGNSLSKMIDLIGGDYAIGDPMRVRQILLNLIGNAIKFTRNGSIIVEARRLPNEDMVEFRVTDTGIGIPVHDRERIFDDFVTLDATFSRAVGGTGLGLAIVRRLVKAMGGTIGLESSEGYGSSFWVRLPMPLSQEPPRRNSKPRTRPPMKTTVWLYR
jgi:signal transduction histidine kinase